MKLFFFTVFILMIPSIKEETCVVYEKENRRIWPLMTKVNKRKGKA